LELNCTILVWPIPRCKQKFWESSRISFSRADLSPPWGSLSARDPFSSKFSFGKLKKCLRSRIRQGSSAWSGYTLSLEETIEKATTKRELDIPASERGSHSVMQPGRPARGLSRTVLIVPGRGRKRPDHSGSRRSLVDDRKSRARRSNTSRSHAATGPFHGSQKGSRPRLVSSLIRPRL